MKIINSREVAFENLKKVFKNKAFSNILLNEVAKTDLPPKFKNLIFAIVHGTITNKILLEKSVNKIIDPKRTNYDVQILLWMSIYQIRFLKTIPLYAVVNEAVTIAKSINPKLAGLVNASLKKVIAQEDELFNYDELSIEEKTCVLNSFPNRLFNLLKNQHGLDNAIKIANDSTIKPLISFRVNTLKISNQDFYNKYKDKFSLIKSNVENCFISKNSIVSSYIYENGLITIQDPASILVVNTLDPKPNTKVFDMCAAPGGKLTHIAMNMENKGTIVAYELNNNKIKLINQNISRLGCLNIELICDDANQISQIEKFDSILLDAPCSGFGVLKRKPEIKINNYDQNKVQEIVDIQKKLLSTAYENLKSNGTLVYSTCTLNRNENQNQIKYFLNKYPDMVIISEEQIFGFENNTDGFYICKMTKK